jgi:proton-dependent oligopeptide transporter, POT family
MEAAVKIEKSNVPVPEPKKKHPRGLYLLFFTEMWERFSYYGMRGILALYLAASYLSGGLGYDQGTASLIFGFYTGACYFTPLAGGYLTDRFLGRRWAITLGGVTMALGNFILFAEHSRWGLYLGLALLVFGNGFFKPNVSTLVGELYEKDDKRRDAAFTIFYMGINLGAFLAPLVVGLVGDYFSTNVNGVIQHGYRYGFLASSIGMIIGQVLFNALSNRFLGEIGKKPVGKMAPSKQMPAVDKKTPLTKQEKRRTLAIIILTCFVVFFWAGFEQAGTSLTFYTQTFVNRNVFGWEVPTEMFQSINPAFIIILAPLIAKLWSALSKREKGDWPTPVKMGLGMILLGIGYMVLLTAVMQTGGDAHHVTVKANILFIIFTYFFHTVGELFLSPIGLSMVSEIAPIKYASLLMGVWLASTGIADILAGQLAAFPETMGYFQIFGAIGALSIIFGIILLALSKKIAKLMA